jgi:hypothetical protein
MVVVDADQPRYPAGGRDLRDAEPKAEPPERPCEPARGRRILVS